MGLLFAGLILGPIAIVLGLLAKNKGDNRGTGAMIVGGVITGLSLELYYYYQWALRNTASFMRLITQHRRTVAASDAFPLPVLSGFAHMYAR